MSKTLLATAALFALVAGSAVQAADIEPDGAEGFTLERSYFEPGEAPVSHDVQNLMRLLDRVRDVRTISSGDANREYTLDTALWERSWRVRVARELDELLR